MKKSIFTAFLIAVLTFSSLGLSAQADNKENGNHDRNNNRNAALASQNNDNFDDMNVRLNISPRGEVEIRGAQVAGINGGNINVSLTWNSFVMNWVVQTNSETKFHRLHGAGSSLGEVSVGNMINANGMLVASASSTNPTILAKKVRNISLRKMTLGSGGSIASINSQAKTFVLSRPNKTNITVVVSDTTKIKKGKQVIAFADLKVNDKVWVSGVFDSSTNTLTAQSIIAAK